MIQSVPLDRRECMNLIPGEQGYAFIYSITCATNGKRYIGCTVLPRGRLVTHASALANGRHRNTDLQSDYNKYGQSAFTFNLIDKTNKRGTNLERQWMIYYRTYLKERGYNYKDPAFVVGGNKNGKIHLCDINRSFHRCFLEHYKQIDQRYAGKVIGKKKASK